MKKFFISLLATLAMTTAHADEGMWTLYNLPTAIYEQMKQEGFQLPMEQLYLSDNAIKNNVIGGLGILLVRRLILLWCRCIAQRTGFHQPPLRLRRHPSPLYCGARLHAQWFCC